jgi:hypothetical protein
MLSHFSTTMKVSSPYFAGEAGLSITGPYSTQQTSARTGHIGSESLRQGGTHTGFGGDNGKRVDHGNSLVMLVQRDIGLPPTGSRYLKRQAADFNLELTLLKEEPLSTGVPWADHNLPSNHQRPHVDHPTGLTRDCNSGQ